MVVRGTKSDVNKADEIKALMSSQWELWECSIMCLTERWLQERAPNSEASLLSFQTKRANATLARGLCQAHGAKDEISAQPSV